MGARELKEKPRALVSPTVLMVIQLLSTGGCDSDEEPWVTSQRNDSLAPRDSFRTSYSVRAKLLPFSPVADKTRNDLGILSKATWFFSPLLMLSLDSLRALRGKQKYNSAARGVQCDFLSVIRGRPEDSGRWIRSFLLPSVKIARIWKF